mmetsp:Transcript_11046/g.20647  ORF Transcript_11046/g.20647 Transcript_11046/m.20647 type:complete len:203 (-) Transcript_11046:961-1569(-)|eukprot:CAMPEP_0201622988 /NCGR_PEP_ID=MMETSP0492-20130828/47686_1 /ASSEMBLY_ACC=CAM_ASM_000837 /TAXON_ID=420259 /ORGANISM="Thalassiosira gravida, Strain GMp14c1" /LENGTH=202 /DNA_ID=CAMNT_0048092591 /DNA_START=137 /DNA_END=745 /DNA_ORIENTATION=+
MKATLIITLLLPLTAHAFSLPSNEIASRRQVGKAIIGGAATSLIVGGPTTLLPRPSFAEEEYITADSGIKYQVVTPPTDPNSPTPARGQKVKAKYTLYLNGFPADTAQAKKIDSSKGPFGEKPFEFFAGVSQVIKGWDLTILEMRQGEARKLVIPSDLGYGDKGMSSIPGGATLYFNVELAGIGAAPSFNADQQKWLDENPL